MLATGIKEYLFIWQLPILGLLVFGWLMLGGYFLSIGIPKNGGKKKTHLPECIFATLLISIIAGIIALIVYKAGMKFSQHPKSIIGFIAGLIIYIALFILMVHTWQKKMTFKQACKTCMLPLISTLLLAAILMGPTAFISNKIRQKKLVTTTKIKQTQTVVRDIWDALFKYGADRPPATLDVLVKAKLLTPEQLKSPIATQRTVGFIYAPAEISRAKSQIQQKAQNIVAADYNDTFKTFRVVLFANGEINQIGEKNFREIVALPINKAFREALKKAEGLEIKEKAPETDNQDEEDSIAY